MDIRISKINQTVPLFEGRLVSLSNHYDDVYTLKLLDNIIFKCLDRYLYVEIRYPGHAKYTSYILRTIDGKDGMIVGCLDAVSMTIFDGDDAFKPKWTHFNRGLGRFDLMYLTEGRVLQEGTSYVFFYNGKRSQMDVRCVTRSANEIYVLGNIDDLY